MLETGCTPCGSWSDWSEVECSETCGKGKMVVERECLTEEGIFADDCPGLSVKVEPCKISDCSTTASPSIISTSILPNETSSLSSNTTLSATTTTTATITRFVPKTVS